ncbi:MAG: Uncharacterised protein [Cryomorphaceae bacterium]|nr:MAG: Uncharacterised protein [Cryomorphaceae bacterium]
MVVGFVDHHDAAVFRIISGEVAGEGALVIARFSAPVVQLTGTGFSSEWDAIVFEVFGRSAFDDTFEEHFELVDGGLRTDRRIQNFGFEIFHAAAVVHDLLDDLGLDHDTVVCNGVVEGK